eukprot:scaffold3330_cov164-Amphora_coffeaeformis.AAC.19
MDVTHGFHLLALFSHRRQHTACGVSIHEGYNCTDASTQGENFFTAPVTADPWLDDIYSSDGGGMGTFSGIVTTGSADILGRVFIVHDSTGAAVACGALQEELTSSFKIYATNTAPIGTSDVTGSFTAFIGSGSPDNICMYGAIAGLAPNLVSFRSDGTDCTAQYGCGVHVYEGTDCTNATTQGEVYFDPVDESVNPWLSVGYLSTDSNGNAEFISCVRTGNNLYQGQAFVVRGNDGSRVSCGILGQEDPPTPPPTPPPTRAPTTASPTTETNSPTFTMQPTTETMSPTEPTTRSPTMEGGSDSAGPSFGSVAALLASTTVFVTVFLLGA